MKRSRYMSLCMIALGACLPFGASAATFSVHTMSATNVTSHSAVLEAYATGFTGDATLGFDWGQENLDSETANETVSTSGEKIRIRVSNLTPSTRYTFRARGTSQDDDDKGTTLAFTTLGASSQKSEEEDLYKDSTRKNTGDLPVQFAEVTTLPVSAVYGNSATLRGFADTYAEDDARYWFQYGVAGEELAPSRSSILREGTSAFSGDVWGLLPDTEYVYRAVVETDLGISLGEVLHFRTTGKDALRIRPIDAHEIAVSDGEAEIYDGEVAVRATVWTAGAPVRVKVEYGSTRAMSHDTEYSYVAQTGEVRIVLPELARGRTYYYRTYAEDGQEYVRGDVVTLRIPRSGNSVVQEREQTKSDNRTGSLWQRFLSAFKNEKTATRATTRDGEREQALRLGMTVEKNGVMVTGSQEDTVVHDILTFIFALSDTQNSTTGTLSFVLPSGCTYLSSDGIPFVRTGARVEGDVTYTQAQKISVRCIVDDVQTTDHVFGTFTTTNIVVTSNEIALNTSSFALGAFLSGAFHVGTSILVMIAIVTLGLAIMIVRIHDRTFGKKEA